MFTEMVVYWACDDPKQYPLGREYTRESAALQAGQLRGQYVVRVSYSMCSKNIIYTPIKESK